MAKCKQEEGKMNGKLLNKRLLMDGNLLLRSINPEEIDLCFFDPQYRSILDKMSYGNEGERKQVARARLRQMPDGLIVDFLQGISRALKPSGYMFFWMDKFIVAEALHKAWMEHVNAGARRPVMNLVDMICWDKGSFGNGYRTRRTNEYLMVYQKAPKSTKSWIRTPSVPDTWTEKIPNPKSKTLHPHRKPIGLTARLIGVVTEPGAIVLDPCAGSFSTLDACVGTRRNFIGCDISEEYACERR